MQEIYPKKDIT